MSPEGAIDTTPISGWWIYSVTWGGEGSGGVIYPELHYGRDALIGVALTFQQLLDENCTISELKNKLPQYYITKKKIDLVDVSPDEIIEELTKKYSKEKINTEDGIRVDFHDHWVHFRKSNTEPIIRIITEAKDKITSNKLADEYYQEVKSLF